MKDASALCMEKASFPSHLWKIVWKAGNSDQSLKWVTKERFSSITQRESFILYGIDNIYIVQGSTFMFFSTDQSQVLLAPIESFIY